MINQRLIDYINSALSKGISLKRIRQNLISNGWSPYDVESAISLVSRKNSSVQNKIVNTKEESSKLWLIPTVVVAFLIITGGFMYFSLNDGKNIQDTTLPETQQNTQQLSSSVTNCGGDVNCLIGKSNNCERSKASFNATLDFFGLLISTTTSYEIKGVEENKCVLYLKTENQTIDISDELRQQMLASGKTQEQIEQQKQESNKQAELTIGKDGLCKFNKNSDLTSLLGKWKSGTSSGSVSCRLTPDGSNCTTTGDWAVADCSGEMFGSSS
jgi:hypothetical protein